MGLPEAADARMRTIAIVNQKGGCGKTTTSINLSATLAARGFRTLLVDLDPQSHCAAGLGVPDERIEHGVAEALVAEPVGGANPELMLWEVAKNLRLAPSTVALAGLEAARGGLAQLADRDARLAKLLDRFADRFDWCVIDCPPTIGLLTFNALRAADEALVPVETGYFALKGSERQGATIEAMAARLGRALPLRILPTLHRPDAKLASDLLAAIQRRHGAATLPVSIREHEALREAAGFGQPVTEYAPGSEACADFDALADWLMQNPVECTRGQTGAQAFESTPAPEPAPAEAPSPRVADLLARMRAHAGFSLESSQLEARAPDVTPAPAAAVTPGATVQAPAATEPAKAEGGT
jgi:chromosome partitioning protein